MKRVGYLYDQIMTYDNVVLAMKEYDKRRSMDKRRGVDYRLAWEILEKMKTDFAGVIGTPRIKYIHEGGKQRMLQIPPYQSCVAQLALWKVCGKYIDRRIHDQSFSSRKGKGGHLAAKKCNRFVHLNINGSAKYHLYFDIRKYYQHIDKAVLMERIQTVFKDKRVIELFRAVVYSTESGLPIGYPFSHALANFYLVPLYFILRSIKNVDKIYVYMDNWTVFSKFKKPLKKALLAAQEWLAGVGCQVKQDWQISPTAKRGARVCGLVIGAGKPRLYEGIFHRLMRNVDKYKQDGNEDGKLRLSLMSRLGWVKSVNMQYSTQFRSDDGGYIWDRKQKQEEEQKQKQSENTQS